MNNGQVIQAFITGETEAKANFLHIVDMASVTELVCFGYCIATRMKQNGMISINEDIPNRKKSLSHKEGDRARQSVQMRLINTLNTTAPEKLMPIIGVGFEVTCKCQSCNEALTVKAPTKKVVTTWERAITCFSCRQTSLVMKTVEGVTAVVV